MPSLESLKQSLLTECEEDHVGLWSVIRDVEEAFPKKDKAAIRDRVLNLLHELLLAHEIQAGFPTPDGRGFSALRLDPDKVLARIEADWPAGHRPTIGEGLWFTKAKKKSRKEAAERTSANEGKQSSKRAPQTPGEAKKVAPVKRVKR
jgi:hypothetical protein